METLEIVVLIGLVAFVALNLALAVCGVRLWKSVRKLTGNSTHDDEDNLVEEVAVRPASSKSDSAPVPRVPSTPEPDPAPVADIFDEEEVNDLDVEEKTLETGCTEETIDELLVSRAYEPVRPRPIETITLKKNAERESHHDRTTVRS